MRPNKIPVRQQVVLVAWNEDDPNTKNDARFYLTVTEEMELPYPPGTKLPKGQPLAELRKELEGDEGDVVDPLTGSRHRITLERWKQADPERTYVGVSFRNWPAESGVEPEEVFGAEEGEPTRVSTLPPELEALIEETRAAFESGDAAKAWQMNAVVQERLEEAAREPGSNISFWDESDAIEVAPDFVIFDFTSK